MMIPALILAAIELVGVTGDDLRARAYFDINNAKVGDPLVLTIDFIGSADFAALHAPALARAVDRRDWKLDDASARTQTDTKQVNSFFNSYKVAVARTLTYRVRPLRPGVLWFPALEFSYADREGRPKTVRSNAIPVHAKPGTDVVVAGMGEDLNAMPEPPALATDPGVALSDDDAFAWRRACARPTADAFAAFDFPAAKLNEARCAVLSNDWKRAMSVCRRLEWTTGQTREIEQLIVAALARCFQNPQAELPVWRQVGRPLLRYPAPGRIGLVVGTLAGLVLLFWLLGRLVRRFAALAFVLLFAGGVFAQGVDPFAQMEEMMRRQEERMRQMMAQPMGGGLGGMNFSFGGGAQEAPKVTATLAADRAEPQVGEPFRFIIRLEAPKTSSLSNISLTPLERFGMRVTGQVEALTDEKSANPTNVIRRLSVPVRYDVPFAGPVAFRIEGMAAGRRQDARRHFSFTFSTSFKCETQPLRLKVKSLPSANQPKDFSNIVATSLAFSETTDLATVESNDVIQITYRMRCDGYLPADWMPPEAAFEIGREEGRGCTTVAWRRYFVADGAAATPRVSVTWYDPQRKAYRTSATGGTRLAYRAERMADPK